MSGEFTGVHSNCKVFVAIDAWKWEATPRSDVTQSDNAGETRQGRKDTNKSWARTRGKRRRSRVLHNCQWVTKTESGIGWGLSSAHKTIAGTSESSTQPLIELDHVSKGPPCGRKRNNNRNNRLISDMPWPAWFCRDWALSSRPSQSIDRGNASRQYSTQLKTEPVPPP